MGDGKHQFFAGGKQFLGEAVGFFQLTAVTVATGDVAPNHDKEDYGQHHGTRSNACNDCCGTMAHRFLKLGFFAGT